ncbi:MAG: rRNA maturation RNase YbeY [Caulobacterales bacterium 32-67-6]|nr:MAG: rRNA maturation RNase YbeY [Caulobacterales bacterium 32-67-6]
MIDIEIEDDAWAEALPDAVILVRAAALAALDGANMRPKDAAADAGLVAVLLTDDEAVAELNAEYRRKAGPTNVLSFPAAQNPEGFLGDLALAYGVCAREAEQQNKSLADHLQHLVAHGVLHLVGYDHMNEDEAAEMEGLERRILAGLGVADPYAAEQGDHD